MPASVWLLNLIVFGVLLEADLGRRKIGWFRLLRPLITAALIAPGVLDSIPTTSHDVALQVIGVAAGVLAGLASHLFVSVYFDPTKGPGRLARLARKGRGRIGRPYSRAGFGYATYWAVIFGARLLFIYGTIHWFPTPLGQFMAAHQLTGAGLTNAVVFMAVSMALARSALLGIRGRSVTRQATAPAATPVTSVR